MKPPRPHASGARDEAGWTRLDKLTVPTGSYLSARLKELELPTLKKFNEWNPGVTCLAGVMTPPPELIDHICDSARSAFERDNPGRTVITIELEISAKVMHRSTEDA